MSEAIQTIIDEMKSLSNDNKTEFNSKFAELTDKLKARDTEYDVKFKTLDEQRDVYIKEHIQPMINIAVEELKKASITNKANNNNFGIDTKIYGNNFGQFLYKVRKNQMELKGLSENVGADGGYLVPEIWSQEVQKITLESSIVRNNGAKTINMPSLTYKVPNVKFSSNADGSQYGGITAYWSDEATAMTSSSPKFEYTELDANKLIGYTEAPEELTEDAFIAIAPFLQQCFGEVISHKEDVAFLSGNGVGKPLGILSAPCTITQSRATSTTLNPIDLVNMISRFKGSLDRAVWVMNQTVLPQIYMLQDNNGNFIFNPGYNSSIASKSPGSLYGIPMITTEKLPALGTTGDIMLVDFGQYLIGDRAGLRIEESMHYLFNTDKNSWRFIKRVDGKPWMGSAITPYLGGKTLSPFVVLHSATS
jgi:HK97 family phage major capsid protein